MTSTEMRDRGDGPPAPSPWLSGSLLHPWAWSTVDAVETWDRDDGNALPVMPGLGPGSALTSTSSQEFVHAEARRRGEQGSPPRSPRLRVSNSWMPDPRLGVTIVTIGLA